MGKILVGPGKGRRPIPGVLRTECRDRLRPVKPVITGRDYVRAIAFDQVEIEHVRITANESTAQVGRELKRRFHLGGDVFLLDPGRTGLLFVGIENLARVRLDPADNLSRMPED